MSRVGRVDATIIGVALLAVFFLVGLNAYYPPTFTRESYLAFGALFALALLSTALALKITEGGTTTSMDFLPELGAILLLGPGGAVILTAATELLSQSLLHRKAPEKVLYNTSQFTCSVGLAGLAYVALGGNPSLTELPFSTFPPFLVAAIIFFVCNSAAVAHIISLSENAPFSEVWQRSFGSILLFDIAISPLAYLVALLYVRFGAATLVLAVVPIVGLRYSYGVNLELKQLNRDILRVLIKALEGRDPYTSGHSVRVAEYAKTLANDIDLGQRKVRLIETAALLHDIGKIDAAYMEILRNPGRLTPRQTDLIRQHPERGVELLSSIRRLDSAVLDYVRHHHERWDGTGYPGGLAGEDIPIGSRIIMVADTIDAMSTARPYRDPLPDRVIREELSEHAASQFDPSVVEAALESDEIWPLDRDHEAAHMAEKQTPAGSGRSHS